MAKRKNRKKKIRVGRFRLTWKQLFAFLIIAAILLITAYIFRDQIRKILTPEPGPVIIAEGDVEIHFLELGNKYTGDSTYIRVGDIDILIDAGSRQSSAATISAYLDTYITDGVIEYVIATHAHQDHIAGFASTSSVDSIFKRYECQNIIDYALTNSNSGIREKYEAERDAEVAAGALHHTAKELVDTNTNVIDLGGGVTMTILDNYYYHNTSSDENNYSVCMLLSQGSFHYLFTGDLEEEGEEYLVELNELPKVTLFKAGHHGSATSSNDALLSVIQPEIVCVCCCAGSDEYTENIANQFPSQAFCDRIAPYTDRVYVTTMATEDADGFTSMNGNITVSNIQGVVTVTCSANDTKLCDTEWFRRYRTVPTAWKRAS